MSQDITFRGVSHSDLVVNLKVTSLFFAGRIGYTTPAGVGYLMEEEKKRFGEALSAPIDV